MQNGEKIMLLKELTQCYGISGYETKVKDLIVENVTDYCDSLIKDSIGNLIALKKGSGTDKKKIMIAAHMDEIGFQVISITSEGFLKVKKLGGISAHTAFMNRVTFENGITGVVACNEKIDKIASADMDKMYIDIGAIDKEDALKYVDIGDIAGYIGEYTELINNNIMSKSFDDRIGCYMMIEALKRVTSPYHDIYFVFTVQEEVGLRGATVAAERIKPDLGIALDITGSFDVPGDPNGNAKLNGGAAICISNAAVICDKGIVDSMVECAKEYNIKYQLDILTNGGTDAGAINRSFEGVKVGGISIATRYGHSSCSIVNKNDLENCIELLHRYLEKNISIETEKVYK